MSKTTHHIEPIRDEFLIEVRFNDDYTKPMYIGGYFKKRSVAQKYLDNHKKMMYGNNIQQEDSSECRNS